jgi:hypothetical protein
MPMEWMNEWIMQTNTANANYLCAAFSLTVIINSLTTYWISGWEGPRASLDASCPAAWSLYQLYYHGFWFSISCIIWMLLEKWYIYWPCQGLSPRSRSPSPLPGQYTDHTILAPILKYYGNQNH